MKEESPKLWRKVHLVALAAALIAGVVIGRAFFPLEIPKPFVVEKVIEKRVEVPVERIVEKRVEVPTEVIKYVDRMVPVEKIVYRDRETSVAPAGKIAWRQLQVGMSMASVRSLLGEPASMSDGNVTYWNYTSSAHVVFHDNKLNSWSEPSQ